jgi:hypothetical protein
MTAQELDYHEVFSELLTCDPAAAELLLDIATVIVGRERQIAKRMSRGGYRRGDAELNRLLNLQGQATGEIALLHERLVDGTEENVEAHDGDGNQELSPAQAPQSESLAL